MKNKSKYLLIVLLIALFVLSFKYIETINQKIKLQDSIDLTFRAQLGKVLDSFSMVVNDYTYRSMVSSVYNVAMLSELTSYEEINDNLVISLYNLFISLREEKSKDLTLLRIEELREIFFELVQDPTNQKSTDRLSQIVSDTFFNNPEE